MRKFSPYSGRTSRIDDAGRGRLGSHKNNWFGREIGRFHILAGQYRI